MQDYYKILEVSNTASQEEIKQSYRMLAKKWHPDANNNTKESEEKFKAINEAYSVLSSPEKRMEYDARSRFQDSRQYDFNDFGNNRHTSSRNHTRTYNNGDWEFTYTYSRRQTDDQYSSDYAMGKIVKGAIQLVVGMLLIPFPLLSIVGVYAVFSGISNVRKGISRL